MSDTYVSREKRCEARRWHSVNCQIGFGCADELVAWVNSHNGEARYEPDDPGRDEPLRFMHPARIVLTTSTGPQYLYPGWYAVMGEPFLVVYAIQTDAPIDGPIMMREFLPVDPATFEADWEPTS